MKNIILGLLLTFSFLGHAALKEADSQYIKQRNYAVNPGFEEALSKWVASGGTLAQVTSGSNLLTGTSSATWDSSSAAQTLSNSSFTIPNTLKGKSGEASCTILTPSGTATHLLEVYDGSIAIASQTVVSSTSPQRVKVIFTMPASGTIQLRLKSVNSNEPLIAIDDCFLGAQETLASITSTQRDAITSPNAATLIYNTTSTKLNLYDGSTWNELGSSSSLPPKNYLYNPEGRFFQRTAPGSTVDVTTKLYGPDRWKVLSGNQSTGLVGVLRTTGSIYSQYGIKVVQRDATARQFGILQIIEGSTIRQLVGNQVTVSFLVKSIGNNISAIRAGVVEWTGTLDTVTNDIVSSWSSTPTLVSNAAFLNTPADLTVTSSYVQYNITVTLGSSMKNVAVFLWTPSTEAQNDDFTVTELRLVPGGNVVPYQTVMRSEVEELPLVKRYYDKSYTLDVPPATVTTVGAITFGFSGSGQPTNAAIFFHTKYPMRIGSGTYFLQKYYSPAVGTVATCTDNAERTATVDNNYTNENGFTGGAAGNSSFTMYCHAIYESEL